MKIILNDIPMEGLNMDNIKVSIFASAVRPRLWAGFFKSLELTTESYEVVFAGPIDYKLAIHEFNKAECNFQFTFIETGNIKPAQCYEIARRSCIGETISWSADDVEYSPDFLGKAYRFWKSLNNEKACLSLQVEEDGYFYNLRDHAYCGFQRDTAMMMPVNLMSRKYLEDLGGFDRRFQCGQYENECACRMYADDGMILPFRDGKCFIDHSKHGKEHRFRIGYSQDRKVLENSWGKRGEAIYTGRLDKFEPYEDKDILVKSQCLTLNSIWI